MHKALSRTLWGVVFVGGLTVLGAGAANAADTSGENGAASGNQIGILGELPVTIGGNAISIVGDSDSSGTASEPVQSPAVADAASTTSGQDGVLAGNQVMPDATLPIVIGGNSVSVIGDSTTEGTATSGATADGSADGTPATTSGDDGIASGNQVAPDVDAPILVSGNDVAVIRDDRLGDEGLLDGTFANGMLNDGMLNDGILNDGVLDDGILNDGALNDGVLNDGVLNGLLQVDPILGDDVRQAPVIRRSLASGPLTSGTLVSEPIVEGPVIGSAMLAVLPEVDAGVAGDDAVVGTDDSPELSPLMATAALSPAMMLAATGVEALPLIGGIVLLLGAGATLVASGRMTHATS